MASETSKTQKRKWWRNLAIVLSTILLIGSLLTACSDQDVEEGVGIVFDIIFDILSDTEETESPDGTEQTEKPGDSVSLPVTGEMDVHFFDMGQADATLFISDGKVMLFDVGEYKDGDELTENLRALGINYIDVLVLSHPHDDHLGAASIIVDEFEIGTIYCPDFHDVMGDNPPAWYEKMEDSIENKYLDKHPEVEDAYWYEIVELPKNENGEFAEFEIGQAKVNFLAPLKDRYSDKNDYSICAIVSFGDIDVMLTGDATVPVEKELMEQGFDLDIEIFQAGHHGSDTSNHREFINAMSPDCIVISCGMKNKYKHPSQSIIDMWEEMKIPVYRTDESGTIIMTTDGKTYSFNVEPGTYTSGEEYREGK